MRPVTGRTTITPWVGSDDSLALLLALLAQNQGTTGTTGGTSSGSTGTNTGVSLTPPGNLTLVDDIGNTSTAGQQFITLVSKSGNTFYMVIDRNDKGEENVHFMNLVDEADLFALLDEDAQSSYIQNQTPAPTEPIPTETEPEPTEPTEPEKPAKKSGWAGIMLLLIIAIGGGGFYVYNFIIKKKQEQEADKPDPDADYEDEDDEEYDLPEEEGYEEETEDSDYLPEDEDFESV